MLLHKSDEGNELISQATSKIDMTYISQKTLARRKSRLPNETQLSDGLKSLFKSPTKAADTSLFRTQKFAESVVETIHEKSLDESLPSLPNPSKRATPNLFVPASGEG